MALAATALREAIATRIEALQLEGQPRFKTVKRDPLPQSQPDDYPAASVFVQRTNDVPDGDGNAGNLRFITDITIAIWAGRKGGEKGASDEDVNDDADAIITTLLTDAELTKLAPDALFESIEHIERARVDPQEGDSYYSFVRLAITFRTRQEFLPVVTDPYRGADVTVAPLDPNGSPHPFVKWNEENDDG